MKTILYFTAIITSILCFSCQITSAADMDLTWDPSPTPDVAGYKLYYRSDNSSFPFEGTYAYWKGSPADSPVDVGNLTNATLTGLTDGKIHYFAVTAYDTAGYESAYSNIVTSGWVPSLISPINTSLGEQPQTVTFNWESNPLYNVTYTLYYGTDPILEAAPFQQNFSRNIRPPIFVIISLIFGSLGIAIFNTGWRKPTIAAGALALTLGLALTGCGGGGSPTGEDGNNGSTTTIVDVGTANYYVAFDFKPSTTYYWKVVANDQTTPGLKYESLTNNFTTAAL